MLSRSSIKAIFEKHETPGRKHSSTYCIYYVQYRLLLIGDELFDYRLKLIHYLQKFGKWCMKKISHDKKEIKLMLKCERDDLRHTCNVRWARGSLQLSSSHARYISSCGAKPIIFLYELMDSFFPLIRIKPIILHPIAFPARSERNAVSPATDGPFTAVIRPGLILPVTHLNRCFVFGS